MVLLASGAVTMKVPPLKEVPSGAVVSESVWQFTQPMLSKITSPVSEDVLGARDGALVERMKRVKASTSGPNGCAVVAASSGSGTVSKAATEMPFEVFSVGKSGLVIPISFR